MNDHRMPRLERYLLILANLSVGVTGVVYGVMRYLLKPTDEWAIVNHPWQPHLQHLHVLAAPLLVFAVAMVWKQHALAAMGNGRRRLISGVALLASFIPMVASGYLIQVAVEPGWRAVWVGVHLVTSGLWLLGYLVHWLTHCLRRVTADAPHGRQSTIGLR
jgi:hypothetical protein